jgi:hypothetical protein
MPGWLSKLMREGAGTFAVLDRLCSLRMIGRDRGEKSRTLALANSVVLAPVV